MRGHFLPFDLVWSSIMPGDEIFHHDACRRENSLVIESILNEEFSNHLSNLSNEKFERTSNDYSHYYSYSAPASCIRVSHCSGSSWRFSNGASSTVLTQRSFYVDKNRIDKIARYFTSVPSQCTAIAMTVRIRQWNVQSRKIYGNCWDPCVSPFCQLAINHEGIKASRSACSSSFCIWQRGSEFHPKFPSI